MIKVFSSVPLIRGSLRVTISLSGGHALTTSVGYLGPFSLGLTV